MPEAKYVYAVSRYGTVKIDRAEVARETPKLYILTTSFEAARFKTYVPKDEVFTTPEAAAEAFVEAQEREVARLKKQIDGLKSRIGEVPRALKWIKDGEALEAEQAK